MTSVTFLYHVIVAVEAKVVLFFTITANRKTNISLLLIYETVIITSTGRISFRVNISDTGLIAVLSYFLVNIAVYSLQSAAVRSLQSVSYTDQLFYLPPA